MCDAASLPPLEPDVEVAFRENSKSDVPGEAIVVGRALKRMSSLHEAAIVINSLSWCPSFIASFFYVKGRGTVEGAGVDQMRKLKLEPLN